MTTLLIAPGPNATPRAVVRTAPGMLALDCTCVTPACRWYTVAELVAVNGRETVAEASKLPERHTVKAIDMGITFTVPMAPNMTELLYTVEEPEIGCELPPLITLWKPLAKNVMHHSGGWLRVWGESPTVWHEALKAS